MPALKEVPSAPQLFTPNHFDKDEFETTETYQKRVDAENERVRRANATAQSNYDAALKEHENAVAANQREFTELSKHNKEPEIVRAAFVSALSAAMTIMYGDPLLVDFKYDADKQTFSGILKSEKGDFNRAVEFAVPLDKAAHVKAQMTDTSLIPQITFNAKGAELSFAKLDIIDNTIKQQQEFQLAENANTITAYENFLRLNPEAPQAAQAKQNISSLQAAALVAAERERVAALAQERQSKKEAALAEKRAKEEEKNFPIIGHCAIGSTVYPRERWNTSTSSGNILADALGGATKEEFIIVYEAVVEGFVGDKVKVMINDYRVQQTKGGGFFSRKTYQGESLGLYADKFIGKSQYYSRSRCSK